MSIKTPTIQDVPKLTLHVPLGRDYGFLLLQTKTVYDGLLDDKQAKLIDDLVQQKQEYDAKCNMYAQESHDKALEYGVRAQAMLLKMQEDANHELEALRQDYQHKLNTMQQQLEMAWRSEKTVTPSGVHMEALGGLPQK